MNISISYGIVISGIVIMRYKMSKYAKYTKPISALVICLVIAYLVSMTDSVMGAVYEYESGRPVLLGYLKAMGVPKQVLDPSRANQTEQQETRDPVTDRRTSLTYIYYDEHGQRYRSIEYGYGDPNTTHYTSYTEIYYDLAGNEIGKRVKEYALYGGTIKQTSDIITVFIGGTEKNASVRRWEYTLLADGTVIETRRVAENYRTEGVDIGTISYSTEHLFDNTTGRLEDYRRAWYHTSGEESRILAYDYDDANTTHYTAVTDVNYDANGNETGKNAKTYALYGDTVKQTTNNDYQYAADGTELPTNIRESTYVLAADGTTVIETSRLREDYRTEGINIGTISYSTEHLFNETTNRLEDYKRAWYHSDGIEESRILAYDYDDANTTHYTAVTDVNYDANGNETGKNAKTYALYGDTVKQTTNNDYQYAADGTELPTNIRESTYVLAADGTTVIETTRLREDCRTEEPNMGSVAYSEIHNFDEITNNLEDYTRRTNYTYDATGAVIGYDYTTYYYDENQNIINTVTGHWPE